MMLGECNKKGNVWVRATVYALALTFFISSQFNALNSAEFNEIMAAFYQRQQKPKIVFKQRKFLRLRMVLENGKILLD